MEKRALARTRNFQIENDKPNADRERADEVRRGEDVDPHHCCGKEDSRQRRGGDPRHLF
jgi:hypothetical protein